MQTRLVLVSTKPTPHARHIVCEPNRIRLDPCPVVNASNNAINPNQQGHSNMRPTVNYAVTGKWEIFGHSFSLGEGANLWLQHTSLIISYL